MSDNPETENIEEVEIIFEDNEMVPLYPATYILELEDDCWYIGNTNNLSTRLSQHFTSSGGSHWTSKHKPLRVNQIVYPSCKHNELLYTLAYMDKYHTKNVRGAYWTKERILSDPIYNNLYRDEVKTAKKLKIF
tara:strand:+ start:1516 stop:1917 length:402 start_codon:yes stop_codon:yes gene_type:complete